MTLGSTYKRIRNSEIVIMTVFLLLFVKLQEHGRKAKIRIFSHGVDPWKTLVPDCILSRLYSLCTP